MVGDEVDGQSDRLLSVDQVAEVMKLSVRSIWKLRSIGALEAVSILGRTRFRASDVQRIIRDGFSLNAVQVKPLVKPPIAATTKTEEDRSPKQMLTVHEVAKLLGLSAPSVSRFERLGHLKATRLSKRTLRFCPDEVRRFLRDGIPPS